MKTNCLWMMTTVHNETDYDSANIQPNFFCNDIINKLGTVINQRLHDH